MADIILTCGQCGNQISVSEYIAAETIVCAKCKASVPVPRREPEAPVAKRLKLAAEMTPAPDPSAPTATAVGNDPSTYRQDMPDMRRGARKRLRRRGSTAHLLWPWIVFLVLAGILCYLRFVPNAFDVDTLIKGAIYALVILHFTVVTMAFADDSFSGVLCAIIPGYSLFYLFVQASEYYLRSVVAAILLAFGWDVSIALTSFMKETYVRVAYWIETTDTMKKDRVP